MRWRWLWTLGLWCCGCVCDKGDYYVDVSARNVPPTPVSGIATIRHTEYQPPSEDKLNGYWLYQTIFAIEDDRYFTDLNGLPPDVFPDGAQVYAILMDSTASDAEPRRTEVTIYDVGGPSPSTLRASAWWGHGLPQLQGAKLEPDGVTCESAGGGCTSHYSRVKVTLDSGESLSVAPGEQRSSGRIRLGNGPSSVDGGCSRTKSDFFDGYLAISP